MVGHSGDDAIDVRARQQLLIAPGNGESGVVGDLAGERVAAVPEIGGADTLDAGKRDGIAQQVGTLHADADHAEADAVTGRRGPRRGERGLGFE